MEAQEIAQNYEGNQEHEDTAPAKSTSKKSTNKILRKKPEGDNGKNQL